MDRSWRPSRGDRMFQISPVYARPQSAVPAALALRRQTRVRTSVEKLAPRMGDRILGVIDPGCRQFADRRPDDDGGLREARPASWAGRECGGCPDDGGVEPFGFKAAKVMASLTNWFREFRKYHRDDQGSGKIVKRDNHLIDATRYLIISGRPTHAFQAAPQTCTQASSWRCDMVVKDPHERRE